MNDADCCFVSLTVGNSSSNILHSTCGNLLMALSLIADGRLSALSKCSVHLYKITFLYVRSVLPSALRIEWGGGGGGGGGVCECVCVSGWGWGSRALWTIHCL